MNGDHTTKTHRMSDRTQYRSHCDLPFVRYKELGGEDWLKLRDEIVPGIAAIISDALRETMEG
jgi:hypothetical protein